MADCHAQIVPTCWRAIMRAATCHLRLGDFEAARSSLRQATQAAAHDDARDARARLADVDKVEERVQVTRARLTMVRGDTVSEACDP